MPDLLTDKAVSLVAESVPMREAIQELRLLWLDQYGANDAGAFAAAATQAAGQAYEAACREVY